MWAHIDFVVSGEGDHKIMYRGIPLAAYSVDLITRDGFWIRDKKNIVPNLWESTKGKRKAKTKGKEK